MIMVLNGTEAPVLDDIELDVNSGRKALRVYNNEVATWLQITSVLMETTGCDEQEAYTETWEIHNFGHTLVHFGSESELEPMAIKISKYAVCEIVDEFGE